MIEGRWGMEPDTILCSDISYQAEGLRPLVLYDVQDWTKFITGATTGPLKPKAVQDAKLISVSWTHAPLQQGGLLVLDQYRLWVVDCGGACMICVPDRLFSRLHAIRFYLKRFVNKTAWRIKVTAQVWGLLPWKAD